MFTSNSIPLIRKPLHRFLTVTTIHYHSLPSSHALRRAVRPTWNCDIISRSLDAATFSKWSFYSCPAGYKIKNLTARIPRSLQKIQNSSIPFLSKSVLSGTARERPSRYSTYIRPEVLVFDLKDAPSGAACQKWIENVLTGNQVSEYKATRMASKWLRSGNELVEADYQTLLAIFGEEYVATIIHMAKSEFIN